MSDLQNINFDYKIWIKELKNQVRSAQIKAAIAVNSELINFYWELGKMISEKQEFYNWGDKLIDQISLDLKEEFPDMQGLSTSNLKYAKRFYLFYSTNSISQQLVDQIPWGHNILIFSKSKDSKEAKFYIEQTIENNWSRDVLTLQIKTNLFDRKGKSITNFKNTLPNHFQI